MSLRSARWTISLFSVALLGAACGEPVTDLAAPPSSDTLPAPLPPSDTVPAPPPLAYPGCPSSGYLRVVNVSTPAQLDAAIAAALPGDQIRLAGGTYLYSNATALVVNRAGSAPDPIWMCGPRTALIRGGVLRVDPGGDFWHFKGFAMEGNASVPFNVWGNGGSRNVYDSLELYNASQEGIILKTGPSVANVIQYLYVHNAGLGLSQFGECIYIGNGDDPAQIVDSTWIHHNTLVDCSAEGIEIKARTRGHLIEFNTITNAGLAGIVGSDAPIEIRGNDTGIFDNTITISPSYSIELMADDPLGGVNNIFRRNTATGADNGKMFRVATNDRSPLTGNIWGCDNAPVPPMVSGLPTGTVTQCTP